MERKRLPSERHGATRRFRLAYTRDDGTQDIMRFYFTASAYENGKLGEVFMRADKTGTLAAGALDAVCIMMSLLLQHGVPLEELTKKLKGIGFPPNGFTGDPEFPRCSSPLDLLAQWLERKFGPSIEIEKIEKTNENKSEGKA